MNIRRKIISGLATGVALTLLGFSALAADAGGVYFVNGEVTASTQDGTSRLIKKGDRIHEGETILTDKRSSAQLKMVDGGVLAIRPDSRLKIDVYRYEKDKKKDRSFFSLLKGSFRSITGFIGRSNKKAFRVKTPTATIGIRGSDADIGYRVSDGLTAVRTFTGEHTLTGKDAQGNPVTLTTHPGQIGIHFFGAAPQFSDHFPFEMPAPRANGKRPQGPKNIAKQQLKNGGNKPPAAPVPGSGGQNKPPLPPAKIAKKAGLNTPLNATPAPIGSGGVGSDMWIDNTNTVNVGNGAVRIDGSPGKVALLGSNQQLLAISDPGPGGNGGFNFIAANGKLAANVGWSVAGAQGTWGVWTDDFVIFDQGAQKNSISAFHYAVSNNYTTVSQLQSLNGTGFSYTKIGGAATNETGAFATTYGVTATGTFSNAPNLGSINVNVNAAGFATGSDSWTGSFSGNIAQLINPVGAGLTGGGGCSPCTTSTGDTSGLFVGPQAEGLLLGIGLTDGINALNGSAVLKR